MILLLIWNKGNIKIEFSDIQDLYGQKLVKSFFENEYLKTNNIICHDKVELSLFITFVLLGKDEMARVFLRIIKVERFNCCHFLFIKDFI